MIRRKRRCRSKMRRWNSISTSVMPGTPAREHLVPVPMRVLGAQRVTGRRLLGPVEHLLPVGHVGGGRRLDEEVGVAGLAVGSGRDELQLGVAVEREELGEHAVGVVDDLLGEVVARVDEAGGEAPQHAVDHRRPCGGVALLEPQQVHLEDLGPSRPNLPRPAPSGVRSGTTVSSRGGPWAASICHGRELDLDGVGPAAAVGEVRAGVVHRPSGCGTWPRRPRSGTGTACAASTSSMTSALTIGSS